MKNIVTSMVGWGLLGLVGLTAAGVAAWAVKNHIDQQRPWMPEDYYTTVQAGAPLEQKYSGRGNYEVSSLVVSMPGTAMQNLRLWYPAQLEQSKESWPLIVVVNASNTAALNYEAWFERLASWGFIVAGNDDRQAGTGQSTADTLDAVLAMDQDPASVLCGKIDREAIGAVGYSQGGAGAINAVTAFPNSRLYRALFTGSAAYPLLARNMGWGYDVSGMTAAWFQTAGTGASDDSGLDPNTAFGGVAPLSSLQENDDAAPDEIQKALARLTGAEHQDMMRTDGYMTAWMLYQLCGDEEAASAFVGEGAELLHNPNWQDVEKNM